MPSSVRFGSRPRNCDDALVLVGLEAVAFENLGDRSCVVRASARAPCSALRRPTRRSRRPSALPSATRRRARGAASCRRRCARSLQSAGDRVAPSRSGSHASSTSPAADRCSGGSPGGSLRAARARRAARSSCPRRGRSESAAPGRRAHARGERRVGLLDAHVHVLAAVLQAAVAQHRARQQARLEQNLKAVADAEHRAAAVGERPHRAP